MGGSVVIGASLALNVLLPGADQEPSQRVIAAWYADGTALYAPALWMYEMTSAVSRAAHSSAPTVVEGRRSVSWCASSTSDLWPRTRARPAEPMNGPCSSRELPPTTVHTWPSPSHWAASCGPPMPGCSGRWVCHGCALRRAMHAKLPACSHGLLGLWVHHHSPN